MSSSGQIDINCLKGDHSKAKRDLDWNPRVNSDEVSIYHVAGRFGWLGKMIRRVQDFYAMPPTTPTRSVSWPKPTSFEDDSSRKAARWTDN